MITFEALDAGYGDCLIVRYMGSGGYERIILVDGGPATASRSDGTSYKPLTERILPRLLEIKKRRDNNPNDLLRGKEKLLLDLVVCTHIDDDHIAGIESLYRELAKTPTANPVSQIQAKHIWFNSFSSLLGNAVQVAAANTGQQQGIVIQSVNQGEKLTLHANDYGAKLNESAGGSLVKANQQPDEFGDAKIWVLNPNQAALKKLQDMWLKEVAAKKKKGLLALGGVNAGIKWLKNDDSKPNLSSIVMLIEKDGNRILLTGDQRGDHVLEGIKEAGLLDENGNLHVEIMKVPHHGAESNNQPSFHAAVTADIYVFCANGKNQNPDLVVLELIAMHADGNRKFTMAFTNGEMAYEPNKGKFEVRKGKEIKTLADAIGHLKTLPGVAANVNFEFRDADNKISKKNQHALIYELAAKP